jgi:hypothetical protein
LPKARDAVAHPSESREGDSALTARLCNSPTAISERRRIWLIPVAPVGPLDWPGPAGRAGFCLDSTDVDRAPSRQLGEIIAYCGFLLP